MISTLNQILQGLIKRSQAITSCITAIHNTSKTLTTSLTTIQCPQAGDATGDILELTSNGGISAKRECYCLVSGVVSIKSGLNEGDLLQIGYGIWNGTDTEFTAKATSRALAATNECVSFPPTRIHLNAGDAVFLAARNISGSRGVTATGYTTYLTVQCVSD